TVGHRGYAADLRSAADRLGVGDRFELIDAVESRVELFEWSRSGDVGLALMPMRCGDVNEQYMPGASTKPFDYLATGMALVSSDLAEWRAWFGDYGRPCIPNDPVSLAAALTWYLEHPAERRAMADRGRERILSDWNYEAQFREVLELMTADAVPDGGVARSA